MEDCQICFQQVSSEKMKQLTCSHALCYNCYLRLDKQLCPFCRNPFIYTQKDLLNRNKLNIEYNWQPPAELLNYIPQELINSSNPSTETNYTRQAYSFDETNNRTERRRNQRSKRRRRKKLSEKEINEKRRIINKKKKMKFLKINRRYLKTHGWWELPIN